MARKKKNTRQPSLKEVKQAKPGKSTGRTLAKAASMVILGSALLAAEQCRANDYVVPYISMQTKPAISEKEVQYSESSTTAKSLAEQYSGVLRPEFQEAYLNSILLNFDSTNYTLAITDCGQCLCSSCNCAISSCGGSCAICSCGACSTCGANACACSGGTCVPCYGSCGCYSMCGGCACSSTMCTSDCSCGSCYCSSMCGSTCNCSTCAICMFCSCTNACGGTSM